jgi:hypothetical protein
VEVYTVFYTVFNFNSITSRIYLEMDRIAEVVKTQLSVNGIESLQVQNHIYGCFVLMEDIAESAVLENYVLKEGNYSFNIDTQFSQIGIRYGFLMDTKLIFESFLPEYKAAWLTLFTEINEKKSLENVDKIEDVVIEIIKTNVLNEMAFFSHALSTGSLPKEWMNKVIVLLTTGSLPSSHVVSEAVVVESVSETVEDNGLVKAQIEKQMKKHRKTKRNVVIVKKLLGKTRRVIKH